MDNISLLSISKSKKYMYFLEAIEAIEDPRINRMKRHSLTNILVMAILGMLCGANTIVGIRNFAERRQNELAELLDLHNGLPSRCTFLRVLGMINPQTLEFWINYWQYNDANNSKKRQYAIDGKFDRANKSCCVRAFDVNDRQVVKHANVRRGSCELATAPELLDGLNLENTVVTADALHTHANIARKIVSSGGDYLFIVKRNQGQLYEDLETYFANLELDRYLKGTYNKTNVSEISRNRWETRTCISTDKIAWLYQRNLWNKLKSISVINSSRSINGNRSTHTRYIISSLDPNSEQILKFSRRHWDIENQCHRQLDITFEADKCTIRNIYAAQNFAIIRDLVASILLNSDSHKSLREQRLDNLVYFDQLLEKLFLCDFK